MIRLTADPAMLELDSVHFSILNVHYIFFQSESA